MCGTENKIQAVEKRNEGEKNQTGNADRLRIKRCGHSELSGCGLLDKVHEGEKQIDCLDYLVYQIGRCDCEEKE